MKIKPEYRGEKYMVIVKMIEEAGVRHYDLQFGEITHPKFAQIFFNLQFPGRDDVFEEIVAFNNINVDAVEAVYIESLRLLKKGVNKIALMDLESLLCESKS